MASLPTRGSERVEHWREAATLALVLAGALAIPLVFLRDPSDMFRLPKAIVLRAEAILIAAVTLGAWLLGAPRPLWWRALARRGTGGLKPAPTFFLPLAALAIVALVTLTSTNLPVSLGALGTAAATAVVFFATVDVARRRGWILIGVPLAAAAGNAILIIVEEANLWMPFGARPDMPHHLQCDALVGNPNEVGGYLGAAALAALALTAERRSVRAVAAAAAIVAGLIASQTLTGIAAFAAGGFFMIALSSWKKALGAAAAAAVIAALVVALVAPMRERAANVVQWVHVGDYNSVFTDRFAPFVAAWTMFVDHPLTGVGPGAFAWQYYDYKLRAEQRYPTLRHAYNRGINFGEVHNDHLQALAEGGVLGYGAFVALIAALASLSFFVPAEGADARQRFARRLALPLAVFIVVLSIAQFPLETTVVRSLLVHLAAICVGWREA